MHIYIYFFLPQAHCSRSVFILYLKQYFVTFTEMIELMVLLKKLVHCLRMINSVLDSWISLLNKSILVLSIFFSRNFFHPFLSPQHHFILLEFLKNLSRLLIFVDLFLISIISSTGFTLFLISNFISKNIFLLLFCT